MKKEKIEINRFCKIFQRHEIELAKPEKNHYESIKTNQIN